MLTVRHPALIEHVVALASLLSDPFAMRTVVRVLAATCSLLTRAGVPGLVDQCPYRTCCQSYHDDIVRASNVPLTCLYTQTDGIVDWRACLRPEAHNFEVSSTHLGMRNTASARRAVAEVLV